MEYLMENLSSNRENLTAVGGDFWYGNDTDLNYEPFDALSRPIQALLICLYTLTALLSLGGNATAIWVLMVGKRSSRELRIFLINLSISDITMALFSIPFTYTDFMLGRWIFHPLFCPFVQFMQLCSVFVSIYTLAAIGIDRYFAIMYPLSSTRLTKSRGTFIVSVIWVIAIGLGSVQLLHSKAFPVHYGNGSVYYDCREMWSDDTSGKIYTMAIFVITFVLPMIVLTFTYASIGWKMYRHTSPGNADATRDEAQMIAKMKVVKMLATVVVLFALCWLPLQVFNLLLWFRIYLIDASTESGFQLQNIIFFACHWIAMANSFVNPIIYCFMSDNFRTDLRQLAKMCCPRWKGATGHRHGQSMPSMPGSLSYGSSFHTTTIQLNTSSIHRNKSPALVVKNGRATKKDNSNTCTTSLTVFADVD